MSRGLHDATRDVEIIDSWWTRWPGAGVAVATGEPSGAWVLDVDGPEGAATLRALTARHGPLPATVTARTGREGGGWHLYWRLDGLDVRNTAARVGPGLDTRGGGGYTIAPPSDHVSGRTYRWVTGRDPYHCAIAPAPDWLVELVTERPEPVPELPAPLPTDPGDLVRYVEAAVSAECADLARTPAGSRNDALNRSAYSLARFVQGGQLDSATLARRLAHAAAVAGLRAHEIERTLRSALRARGAA